MSKPKQYKVRDYFWLWKSETCYPPGTVLDLTDEEALFFAAQIEIYNPPKAKADAKVQSKN